VTCGFSPADRCAPVWSVIRPSIGADRLAGTVPAASPRTVSSLA
jgi:hypothetical protein